MLPPSPRLPPLTNTPTPESNTLARLQRKPSALQAYLTWSTTTKSQHGSITSYILSERLHWPPPPTGQQFQTASPTPLSNPSDYKILPNDWPYSFSPGISHTVVWLKHRLPVDEDTGDLTPASKTLIEEFVQEKFVRRLEEALKGKEEKGKEEARERVMWFKNWTGLQSVRALEHFHVLGKDIPEEVLRGWRGGVEALGDEEG